MTFVCKEPHFSHADKRGLISEQLMETPQKSNRQIASGLGVDDKAVGSVRRNLESRAEIPHQTEIIGRDGVVQPSRKPIKTEFRDEGGDSFSKYT